jgi:hypothetical protein
LNPLLQGLFIPRNLKSIFIQASVTQVSDVAHGPLVLVWYPHPLAIHGSFRFGERNDPWSVSGGQGLDYSFSNLEKRSFCWYENIDKQLFVRMSPTLAKFAACREHDTFLVSAFLPFCMKLSQIFFCLLWIYVMCYIYGASTKEDCSEFKFIGICTSFCNPHHHLIKE